MEAALRAAHCEVVGCPDVYRALARLGGSERGQFCAVIVCVDLMDTAQSEFFQLAVRRHRRVPVYVYGQAHAQSKLELAQHLGAKDTIRPETVDKALPYFAPTPAVRQEVAPAASARSEPAAEPTAEPAPEDLAAPGEVTDSGDRSAGEQEEPSRPVRVPWLRYDGGPTRLPPKRTPASAKPSPPAERELEPEPPLLTPEELAALMGDSEADDPAKGRGKGRKRR